MDYALYDQFEQVMGETENARQDAYQESVRCGKAEKDAIDVMSRVISLLYGAAFLLLKCADDLGNNQLFILCPNTSVFTFV